MHILFPSFDRAGATRTGECMKVAEKSQKKRRAGSGRATLTLSAEIYRKIDQLRGDKARSVWVQNLIEREEQERARQQFAQSLAEQYTPKVCRETLAVHAEFPVHEQ